MLKAMLRGLFAHKLRLILSALAIILGTAFMSAAFVGGDTISKGFTELFSTINEDIDAQVTATSEVPGCPAVATGPWSPRSCRRTWRTDSRASTARKA